MIEIYLTKAIDEEETLELHGIDGASFSDDEKYLVLYSNEGEDSVIPKEVGRIKGSYVAGYYVYEE